jgi:hypothetical protein
MPLRQVVQVEVSPDTASPSTLWTGSAPYTALVLTYIPVGATFEIDIEERDAPAAEADPTGAPRD